jgi:hypothetical protein
MAVRPGNSVDDHIAFIDALEKVVDFYSGLRLAMDIPIIQRRSIMEAFSMVQEVICDRDAVYRITEEFHVGFAAQSGLRALKARVGVRDTLYGQVKQRHMRRCRHILR